MLPIKITSDKKACPFIPSIIYPLAADRAELLPGLRPRRSIARRPRGARVHDAVLRLEALDGSLGQGAVVAAIKTIHREALFIL